MSKKQQLFAVINNVTKEHVFVKRGEVGFYGNTYNAQDFGDQWERVRATQTDEQTEAAMVGSMFGWDVPGAAKA